MNHSNRQKLYVVLNNQGDIQERDCTIAEAAQTVMGYDGHSFEIRPASDGKGFALWASQFSRNSPAGGRPLVKSVIFSLSEDRSAAEAEIFKAVAVNAEWWMGCDVREQAEYDAEVAALAAEEGDE